MVLQPNGTKFLHPFFASRRRHRAYSRDNQSIAPSQQPCKSISTRRTPDQKRNPMSSPLLVGRSLSFPCSVYRLTINRSMIFRFAATASMTVIVRPFAIQSVLTPCPTRFLTEACCPVRQATLVQQCLGWDRKSPCQRQLSGKSLNAVHYRKGRLAKRNKSLFIHEGDEVDTILL
jgi:hypothetical protein